MLLIRWGDKCKIGQADVILRKHADMSSDQVTMLPADYTVKIIEVGSGAFDNRVRVQTPKGMRGRMSVVSAFGNTLIGVDTSGRAAAAQPEPEPGQPGAGGGSVASPAATGPDNAERATGSVRVGDSCLTMGDVAVRVDEELFSPMLLKLTDGHVVDIIEIGAFETGRRVKISTFTTPGGPMTGWVSCETPFGTPKLQRIIGPELMAAARPTSKALPTPKRQRHMY